MYYSFDVFDTCVVRTIANPADLHYKVAERILFLSRDSRSGEERFGREEICELAKARISAERRANLLKTTEAVTLDDIYAQLPELDSWQISSSQMKQEEIRVELESVRPVAAIRRRVERLQSMGEKLIFISDMYLPEQVIRKMLETCGFLVAPDALYVSSELGLTKKSGNLFHHILRKEGISCRQLMHCGDGVQSDFFGAQKAGVRAEIITSSHLNRFEKAVLKINSHAPWVTSQLAAISKVTRLGYSGAEELQKEADIASSVIAPLLTAYVSWVINDARKNGIKRLYFVARDGQILHKIAEVLSKSEEAPELSYLYGSRQAWYLPSVFEINRCELEFVLMPGQSSAPRHNLKRLNLIPEDLAEPLSRYGFPPSSWDSQLQEQEVEQFWQFIEDPAIAAIIISKARSARELALAYFKQEGLLNDDKWALVDVGWTLRTQASFKKILSSAGQSHAMGYYLGICRSRFSSLYYGKARCFLLEEAEDQSGMEMQSLFQNKGLIDQVFTMADHGSTKGYIRTGDKISPELAEMALNPRRQAFLAVVHATVISFAAEFAKSSLSKDHHAEMRAIARCVTGMLLAHPTRAEARTLAWAPISDDPNELRAAPLARSLSLFDLYKIAFAIYKRAKIGSKSKSVTVPSLFYKDLSWGFSWLEGSAALSPFWGKTALWGFREMQYLRREKKMLAARPIVFWQRLFRSNSVKSESLKHA